MNQQRDLLPFILGGLFAVAVAVAITAMSTNRTAATVSPPSTPIAAPRATVAPAAALTQAAGAQSTAPPQPTAEVSASQSAAPQAQAAGGQIWQCMTNGVETFSNNPCGDNATLLDVGPINTMHPPPVADYARAYSPQARYAPAYSEQSQNEDQDAYADDGAGETAGNSYTIVQGIRVPRRRPEHQHRPPYHHNTAPAARRY